MASRADNLEGSCREILTGKSAGRWRVQYIQVDELGRKARLSRLFPNKTAGKEFLRGLKRGEKVETVRREKELTLGAWFDWLVENDWPDTLAAVTIRGRVTRFDKYVRREWGEVPLKRLDPLAVKAFYKGLPERGVGKPTVLEIKRDLVRAFNQAVMPYQRVPWTTANPFRLYVETPDARNAVALTPVDARKAIENPVLSGPQRALLATFLLSGMRLGELMALTKGQLLFDQCLIYVDRAVRIDPQRGQSVGLPKGNKKRLAAMCPTLRVILSAFAGDLSSEQYLWPKDNCDEPRLKRNVYRTWHEILAKVALPSDLSPHDCRLSHVNWIEKLLPEVSSTTLKEHIGHASGTTVTEVNYTRPLSSAQLILAEGIETVVFGQPSQKRIRRRT